MIFEEYTQEYTMNEAEETAAELGQMIGDLKAEIEETPEAAGIQDEVEHLASEWEQKKDAEAVADGFNELRAEVKGKGGSMLSIAKKITAIAGIALFLTSCSITRDNNGFHIGRGYSSSGGGCGAWTPRGGFHRH